MGNASHYVLFHKPYGVLSQFTKEVPDHRTLADYLSLPADVYPVGRLDKDSEGLLLLTNDNTLKSRLLSPSSSKHKVYLAQVEGNVTEEALQQLRQGTDIKINKKVYRTKPAKASKLIDFTYADREPPVRYRAEIPTSWIEISITEGKNRQVRRMGASVGHPVLRLIRTTFAGITDPKLPPGSYRHLTKKELSLL